ncbi:MAG TPA: alanine--tRNA ligase [Phycisphaerales bacterium]|nr:alanine--tRNA ligase [Phycisphaerales bacterium]
MPWSCDSVRSTFIDFFVKKHAHAFVPSSPCVPVDDPTLLFTNAGMNQFKPIFLGQADPNTPMGRMRRAANSQKCIRAGGKHNDLDDVGRDTYHHTFFEMLGNWSFGDYFKEEAIAWSVELLCGVYGVPRDRLYATYFEGNEKLDLAPDEETRAIWRKYLADDHIIPGNMKDNFWEMGDTGPCGPCTEIHFDRIGGRNAAAIVNKGDPDVIEIWNNVFIQFNREEDKSLRPLPAKHVDTGMGLERLVSVLQNKRSNYDTDVFAPIFMAIERATGARSYEGRMGERDHGNIDTAYRVIADHIRTLTFAITDGATPSNVGRGYVLRRILRRAVRYGRQMLGARTGFFAGLAPVVVERFGGAFPELKKNPQRVMDIIREEEESFGKTLDRGIKLFADVADAAKGGVISGADAFRLYDTYGFPIDLTMLMADERGLKIDIPGYEAEVEKAREVSKAGPTKADEKPLVLTGEQVARLRHLGVDPTDDSPKFDPKQTRAHVRAIWNGHNFDEHTNLHVGSTRRKIGVITDRTPFYATMGGQEGDRGEIHVLAGAHQGEFEVESTSAFGGYVLHVGHMQKGTLRVGDTVNMLVDRNRRGGIARNHTATHLANLALRDVLGDGVDQKGSLVAPDRMRFDFSHGSAVTGEQLAVVEQRVSDAIARNLDVYAAPAPIDRARAIHGLRAVFGEAYPDPVRVVSVGVPVEQLLSRPDNPEWRSYSVEFCGGTHVPATGEIGAFALMSEEAVAKGVRRITAVTGAAAAEAQRLADQLEQRIKISAGAAPQELAKVVTGLSNEVDTAPVPASRKTQLRAAIAALQEKVKALGKQMGAAVAERAVGQARSIAQSALSSNSPVVVGQVDCGDDRAALQAAVKTVRDTVPRAAVMLFSVDPTGKAMMHASVPDPLIAKGLKAGAWLRDAAAAMGGKGGGKDDNAQGGGPDGAKIREAMRAAEQAALKVVM